MIDPYYIIIGPIFIGMLLYLLPYSRIKYIAVFLQICIFMSTIINYLYIRRNGDLLIPLGGFDPISLISLRYDLVSSLFVSLTAFLFLAFLIFNLHQKYMSSLFLFLFITLESLIFAIFLSNDLFNIYVIYEVSIIIVSILIMFKKDATSIFDGFMYLMINIVAMCFFLLGLGFLYKTFGTLDILRIRDMMPLISDPKVLIIPYSLIITAIGLKTALMPLFSWLPNAHASKGSPSVISALLSGLYVKASIYLFLRVREMFSHSIDMSQFFMIVGLLTGIIGFFLATSQKDIKLILAYSTISQLGLIMIGINTGSEAALYGALYHIINHAFFKSTLFMTAGIISDAYQTRNVFEIKGLFSKMPVIAYTALISILGITGAPLFNGSISKYLIQGSGSGSIMEYGMILINIGTIITFLKYSSMFFGQSDVTPYKVNKNRTVIVMILSSICFFGGIFGREMINMLFNIQVQISALDYLDKSLIFLLSLLVGYLIYTVVIKDSLFIRKVREFELGFNDVCVSIAVFFVVTAVITYLKLK